MKIRNQLELKNRKIKKGRKKKNKLFQITAKTVAKELNEN